MPKQFFQAVLPTSTGYVPIITRDDLGNLRYTQWFIWPTEADDLYEYVSSLKNEEVYFSPMLFSEPKTRRTAGHVARNNVTAVSVVYADADGAQPDVFHLEPSVKVATSEGKWHTYWRITDEREPAEIEALARTISLTHRTDGVDSGWPLSKRLRVPGTVNKKYDVPYHVTAHYSGKTYSYDKFTGVYVPTTAAEAEEEDMPQDIPNAWDVLNTVEADPELLELFQVAPLRDYSHNLYRLELKLFDQGLDAVQVFAVCRQAACNKFNRPGRSESELWKHVLRARTQHEQSKMQEASGFDEKLEAITLSAAAGKHETWDELDLLDPDEREGLPETFIDRYADWCMGQSAVSVRQYHEGSAFMILATLLSEFGYVRPTFGIVNLNLYMLFLGHTTRSRKTTSRNFMLRVLDALTTDDYKYEVGQDVTPEALTEYLASRPGRSNLYWRDEVQELFEAVQSGGYLRGLFAMLTNAYDGKVDGVLRKTGSIQRTAPTRTYLNFYGMGITEHVVSAVNDQQFESGFLPRFLWVLDRSTEYQLGAADVQQYDPAAHEVIDDTFNNFVLDLTEARTVWSRRKNATGDRELIKFTDEAWTRWQQLTVDLAAAAENHATRANVLVAPAERAGISALKMAALLAMSEMTNTVELHHVLIAIKYLNEFMKHAEYVARQVSKSEQARDLEELEELIYASTKAVTYRMVMKHFKGRKTLREVDELIKWMEEEGTITIRTSGRTKVLEAT